MDEERNCRSCGRMNMFGECGLGTALEVSECLDSGWMSRWTSRENDQVEMPLDDIEDM